jgi:pimeloyl-ACP methyl ester carboxylesterase
MDLATGDRPAVVLLHGVTMSGRVWRRVTPLLEPDLEVHTPTSLGHRGGSPVDEQPTRVSHLVDDMERYLDAEGLDQPHLVGNSLGGWMALELARRGRAASVCAISPGGFWDEGGRRGKDRTVRTLERIALLGRLSRPLGVLPHLLPLSRRIAMADVAERADQLSPRHAASAVLDLAECVVLADILTTHESVEPFDELPCPVTIAWAERDRILPLRTLGQVARERIPQARFVILPGVGHVPMIDDPAMVADVVLRTTRERGQAASTGSAKTTTLLS